MRAPTPAVIVARRRLVAFAAFTAMTCACSRAPATPKPTGPLAVREAWMRSADSGATGGAYLTLANVDTMPLSITGWSTNAAQTAELHESMQMQGMMHMTPRPTVTIPRDSTLRMVPGGLHVMLTKLTRALRAGDSVTLTVTLSDGRTVSVVATVRAPVRAL